MTIPDPSPIGTPLPLQLRAQLVCIRTLTESLDYADGDVLGRLAAQEAALDAIRELATPCASGRSARAANRHPAPSFPPLFPFFLMFTLLVGFVLVLSRLYVLEAKPEKARWNAFGARSEAANSRRLDAMLRRLGVAKDGR